MSPPLLETPDSFSWASLLACIRRRLRATSPRAHIRVVPLRTSLHATAHDSHGHLGILRCVVYCVGSLASPPLLIPTADVRPLELSGTLMSGLLRLLCLLLLLLHLVCCDVLLLLLHLVCQRRHVHSKL